MKSMTIIVLGIVSTIITVPSHARMPGQSAEALEQLADDHGSTSPVNISKQSTEECAIAHYNPSSPIPHAEWRQQIESNRGKCVPVARGLVESDNPWNRENDADTYSNPPLGGIDSQRLYEAPSNREQELRARLLKAQQNRQQAESALQQAKQAHQDAVQYEQTVSRQQEDDRDVSTSVNNALINALIKSKAPSQGNASGYGSGRGQVVLPPEDAAVDGRRLNSPGAMYRGNPTAASVQPITPVATPVPPHRKPIPQTTPSPDPVQLEPTNATGSTTCLKLDKVYNSGGISLEAATLVNMCSMRVTFTFCVDSANGGGDLSCRRQSFGSDSVKGFGKVMVSVSRAGNPFRIYWGECYATPKTQYPLAVKGRFTGSGVSVECH